jgi:hypothetical protein
MESNERTFSPEDLCAIQTNVTRMLNTFKKAEQEERKTIDYLLQCKPGFHPELGEKKLEIFHTIQDACRSIINSTGNEYTISITKIRSDLKEFLEIYSIRDDHSISFENENGKTVHLKDEKAYLRICNELKIVYDTFSDSNLVLIRSPEWGAFRSVVTGKNIREI